MLYSQHFTFHWKLLGLVSRIEKSGTGDNNFGKWKGTFRSDRPKWPDRSQWTTFQAGPEYSGRTKPKRCVPFDVPTEITGTLGWMESAPIFPVGPVGILVSLRDRRSKGKGKRRLNFGWMDRLKPDQSSICQRRLTKWLNDPLDFRSLDRSQFELCTYQCKSLA